MVPPKEQGNGLATGSDQFSLCSAQTAQILQRAPSGLITDIDGTICRIAPSPIAATVTSACRRYLKRLTRRLDLVAVVSGRPALEALLMIGVEGIVYVGNHGLEQWENERLVRDPAVAAYIPQITEAYRQLQEELALMQGLIMENKSLTLSLHYREAQEPTTARQAILTAIAKLPSPDSLTLTEGKMVVELRPPVALDKGTAVVNLVDRYGLHSIVYLGDDVTDVDAFRALRRWRQRPRRTALNIGVLGADTPPTVAEEADMTLQGPEEAEHLLSWLAKRLPPRPRSGRA